MNGAGCYGFRLHGVDDARALLVGAPDDWPDLRLVRSPAAGAAPPAHDAVGPDAAELPLQGGGSMRVDRLAMTVSFALDRPLADGELVHPYLAPAAAVAARWAGRETFHAGAILRPGGAWAVLGEKERGKSSTLGWLAVHGLPVVADDLVVLDGGDVLAGPRCVDLREDAASRLGGEPLGLVGARERWRLALDPVPARAPLRGWIVLEWADEVAVEPLRGPQRLLALMPHRSVQLQPPAPGALVELAALPVLALRRPRRWESMPEAAERLVAATGG